MSENLLKKKIQEQQNVFTTEEEIVKNSITQLAIDANNIRSEQSWENVLFGIRYISLFKKWLFFVHSPYYRETETTVFSLALENDGVVFECSFWLEEKKYKIDTEFYNCLTDDFLAIIKTSEFTEMICVFNDLVNTRLFDLTVFYEEYMRYSPANLYVKVDSSFFKSLMDERNGTPRIYDFDLVCNAENLVHQPYPLDMYKEKYGEINGYRVVCIDVQGNVIKLKFVV